MQTEIIEIDFRHESRYSKNHENVYINRILICDKKQDFLLNISDVCDSNENVFCNIILEHFENLKRNSNGLIIRDVINMQTEIEINESKVLDNSNVVDAKNVYYDYKIVHTNELKDVAKCIMFHATQKNIKLSIELNKDSLDIKVIDDSHNCFDEVDVYALIEVMKSNEYINDYKVILHDKYDVYVSVMIAQDNHFEVTQRNIDALNDNDDFDALNEDFERSLFNVLFDMKYVSIERVNNVAVLIDVKDLDDATKILDKCDYYYHIIDEHTIELTTIQNDDYDLYIHSQDLIKHTLKLFDIQANTSEHIDYRMNDNIDVDVKRIESLLKTCDVNVKADIIQDGNESYYFDVVRIECNSEDVMHTIAMYLQSIFNQSLVLETNSDIVFFEF